MQITSALPGPGSVPRHPFDPDPVRSTKAAAVLALGVAAALTGLLVGGIVPATLALLLSRQARREAYTSGGYLTGAAWLRQGERLAWTGLVLAAAVLVVAVVIGVVRLAEAPLNQDFAPGTN